MSNSLSYMAFRSFWVHLSLPQRVIRTYVLTIIDGFTKYVHTRAVRSTSARLAVNTVKDLALHFGTPSRIITDRGSAFTSKQFSEFCKKYNIELVLNASATPRANGQVERYHRTILHALRTLSDQESKKWENHLQTIQWSLNSTPHSTTKFSPQQLIFGFSPRPMIEDKLTLTLLDEQIPETFVDEREQYRDEASQRIKNDQAKQKKRFEYKFKEPKSYHEGDSVVIFREPPATGESRKLLRRFRGPYTVTTVLQGDRYRVEDTIVSDGRRRFRGVIPADHMRLVVSPEDLVFSDDSCEEED